MINNENNKIEKHEDKKKKNILAFLRNEEGNGFIEKILIIGLFAFVVSAAVTYMADASSEKLETQADNLGNINDTVN